MKYDKDYSQVLRSGKTTDEVCRSYYSNPMVGVFYLFIPCLLIWALIILVCMKSCSTDHQVKMYEQELDRKIQVQQLAGRMK